MGYAVLKIDAVIYPQWVTCPKNRHHDIFSAGYAGLKIDAVIYPQWVTCPKNRHHDIFSAGYAAHPAGYRSLPQIIMAVCSTFFKFQIAGLSVCMSFGAVGYSGDFLFTNVDRWITLRLASTSSFMALKKRTTSLQKKVKKRNYLFSLINCSDLT
jgi:hypothetical protein